MFEGQPHELSGTLMRWMEDSSRFTAFIEMYRDKVRKKIRVVRDPESAGDLLGELEVAYCLLGDRRFSVAYEPYASAKRRGPDFAVTYRANLLFNIEVARIRAGTKGEDRILRIFMDKLEQMQPGMANLLVIHIGQQLTRSIDLGGLMQDVKIRVEKKDPAFYAASRYTGPAEFYRDFLHLSAILLWAPEAQPWVNKQARPALPEKVLHLITLLPLTPGSAL